MGVDEIEPIAAVRPETGLRVEVVRSLENLADYAGLWDELAAQAPNGLPSNSYAWMASHFECITTPDDNWACLFAFDVSQLVGVLPLVVEPHTVLGMKRHRVSAPHHADTFAVELLLARGREREVMSALLRTLNREYPGRHALALHRIPDGSPTLTALQGSLPGHVALTEPVDPGSYWQIGKSFEAYEATLSSHFKHNLHTARKRLATLPEIKTVFLAGPEATEKDLDRFVEVEGAGWKTENGSSIKVRPKLRDFYRDLTRRFSRLGCLEWHFLMSGDRTLAGHMAIRTGRNVALLKIGYDEAFASCSPGNMLLEHTLQRAYAAGDTDEIDCLYTAPWNKGWAMSSRSYYNCWIYPRRLLPLATDVLVKATKSRLRRMPGLIATYRRLLQWRAGESALI